LKIPILKKKDFFTLQEKDRIVEAIRQAEKLTSGELRVFVESHCRFVDSLDRAAEVFHHLKMEQTALRNGVLVYVAMRDRQLAIYGDKGIHEKVGHAFWKEEVSHIVTHMHKDTHAEAIAKIIGELGEALRVHFPYDKGTDINELPDDIVFGR
jgi:uncharacterized membrane protein